MSNLVRFPIEQVKRLPEAMVQNFMATTDAPRFVVEQAIRKVSMDASERAFEKLVIELMSDDELLEELFAPVEKPEEHRYMPAYCDPDNERKGSRYEETRNLDIKEVAKILRGDIKEAIKAGKLPKGLKVSVRIDRYSGGQSLDVRVTGLPEGMQWHTDEYAVATEAFTRPANRYNGFDGKTITDEAEAVLDTLSEMRESFNRDNSDSMVDYFDVRYYGSTGIDWELDRDLRKVQIERLKEEGKL